MELVSNAQFRLSKNGGATQVILHCHGGWSTDDGKLFVPNGMVIHFYSAHGQFGTNSQSLAEGMLGAQTEVSLDPAEVQRLMKMIELGTATMADINRQMDEAKAQANSRGIGSTIQICESVTGHGLGRRQKVYNYSLSYKGPRDSEASLESLFRQHQAGGLTAGIDLLVMQRDQTGSLKDAIRFARSEGEKYAAFHFLPCRYVDTKDVKSMRTVNLPKDFGGAGYIETSVL